MLLVLAQGEQSQWGEAQHGLQAKDERNAANSGWRWALAHARGMARDIGLVLRIRSFQILILQAPPLPFCPAWQRLCLACTSKLAWFAICRV